MRRKQASGAIAKRIAPPRCRECLGAISHSGICPVRALPASHPVTKRRNTLRYCALRRGAAVRNYREKILLTSSTREVVPEPSRNLQFFPTLLPAGALQGIPSLTPTR